MADLGSSTLEVNLGNGILGQNRKENYGIYILVYHVDFISRGAPVYGAMGVKWTTLTFKELSAQRTLRMDAKYWLKRQASSCKRQATRIKSQACHNPVVGCSQNRKEENGNNI